MPLVRNLAVILILGLGLLYPASAKSAEIKVITTLLPAMAKSEPEMPDKMLKISASGTDSIESTSRVRLNFDLSEIPRRAAVVKATLRLVGKSDKNNPQFVRIVPDATEESIGAWTSKPGKSIFSVSTDRLRQIVEEKLHANQTLSLTLSSEGRLSDWRYYSNDNYADTSSFKPRLIIEYEVARQPVAPTERTIWKFFPESAGFKVKSFLANPDIISNPVFYKDNIYLFAKPTDTSTYLYALFFSGRESWSKKINDTPAAHALASSNGILYSIGENRIALYDLKQEGILRESITIQDFKLSVLPTLGADGSLYFVRYGNIYGLNPKLEELWRYPLAPDAKVSRIVLGLDAQKYAYALTRIDKKNQLVSINTADGSAAIYEFDSKYTDFHRLMVVANREPDYIFASAYSVSDGILASFSGGEQIWKKMGPVSQPIADKEGNRIFLIQNGNLQAYEKFNGEAVCASDRADLAATSNLVMDGADNVYFWNNSTFFGYNRDCIMLFEQNIPDLPERLELLFAPDGTLFARSETQKLSLILPTLPAFTLDQNNLQSDTIYSADTIQVAKNLNLDSTANIILKVKDNISFGTGLSVKKGARLSCKVGF